MEVWQKATIPVLRKTVTIYPWEPVAILSQATEKFERSTQNLMTCRHKIHPETGSKILCLQQFLLNSQTPYQMVSSRKHLPMAALPGRRYGATTSGHSEGLWQSRYSPVTANSNGRNRGLPEKKKKWLDFQNCYNSTAFKAIQKTSHKHSTPSPDTNVI